jgi:hypothetical protein
MALDVYVMPLWRFKAGDYVSPISAALGVKPKVIALSELPPEPPWYLWPLAKLGLVEPRPAEEEPTPGERRGLAQLEVQALKHELSKLTGTAVDWPDDGDVRYSQQYRQPAVMRAFAAWHDHRDQLPEFAAAPDADYYKHPVWKLPKPAGRRYPTLVGHSLHTGYFIPVPFEGVHRVEPFKIRNWEFFHDVASTQTVRRELADLLESVRGASGAQGQQAAPTILNEVLWYAEELERICTLSLQHSLPVIFHG